MRKKKVLFYSSVKSKTDFVTQKFYVTDIEILTQLDYDVILSNKISDALKLWKFDLAFIYFYKWGFFVALISKIFCKRVFFTGGIDQLNIETNSSKNYIIQKIFYLLCSSFSNKNIIVSNSDLSNIRKFKRRTRKETISHHVIDFRKYQYCNEVSKEKIISTIAWMGDVDNIFRKGVDVTLKIFKLIFDIDPDYRLYIIGQNGIGSDILKSLIRDLGITDAVIFTGSISEEDKIQILKRSKYYFQFSKYEGFGIAAIEALAAGNIIFHSGNGGLKDGVGDNGIIYNPLLISENELVEKFFVVDKNDNNDLIQRGISHVRNNFSFEKRLDDFRIILK